MRVNDAKSLYADSRNSALAHVIDNLRFRASVGQTCQTEDVDVCHVRHVERELLARGYRVEVRLQELSKDARRVEVFVRWDPPIPAGMFPKISDDDPDDAFTRNIVNAFDDIGI
jgi:hypothetical protein